MRECPPMKPIPRETWQSFIGIPKPELPWLIPGLLLLNAERMMRYREQYVAYAIGRAEQLQFGIDKP